jgi:hypothetical protein
VNFTTNFGDLEIMLATVAEKDDSFTIDLSSKLEILWWEEGGRDFCSR